MALDIVVPLRRWRFVRVPRSAAKDDLHRGEVPVGRVPKGRGSCADLLCQPGPNLRALRTRSELRRHHKGKTAPRGNRSAVASDTSGTRVRTLLGPDDDENGWHTWCAQNARVGRRISFRPNSAINRLPGPANDLPFSCKPAAESAPRSYTMSLRRHRCNGFMDGPPRPDFAI
jgi:hypothetical protein